MKQVTTLSAEQKSKIAEKIIETVYYSQMGLKHKVPGSRLATVSSILSSFAADERHGVFQVLNDRMVMIWLDPYMLATSGDLAIRAECLGIIDREIQGENIIPIPIYQSIPVRKSLKSSLLKFLKKFLQKKD